jgi:hypothetical protein
MYADLAPFAAKVRGAALSLLFFSILFMGSLEGLFGLLAACGILCCAAPGALGTAHAARCARIMATVCAVLSLMHIMCLSTFAVVVMPEMPKAFHKQCVEEHKQILAQGAADVEYDNAIVATQDAAPATSSESFVSSVMYFGLSYAKNGAKNQVYVDDEEEPSGTATTLVAVSTAAARRLQDYVMIIDEPSADQAALAAEAKKQAKACAKAEDFFVSAVPTYLVLAMFVEMGLFVSAMRLARASAMITAAARAYGANGI